jgi:hypothetical protein
MSRPRSLLFGRGGVQRFHTEVAVKLIAKGALALALSMSLIPVALPVTTAQAQTPTGCARAGEALTLSGVTDKQAGTSNEARRTLGVVALYAARDNCNIQLICVNNGEGEAATNYARQQCVVVRDILVRANKGKGWDKENIFTSRQNPGNGLQGGIVYVSFI